MSCKGDIGHPRQRGHGDACHVASACPSGRAHLAPAQEKACTSLGCGYGLIDTPTTDMTYLCSCLRHCCTEMQAWACWPSHRSGRKSLTMLHATGSAGGGGDGAGPGNGNASTGCVPVQACIGWMPATMRRITSLSTV